MNPKDLFNTKSTFVFSEKLKHSNITLTGQMIAKSSTGTQSYKFCLLEPNINLKNLSKPLTFAFKININNVNYGNNWIAVGVCHKNIIVQKNYNFTFSTLGHGAYMVSSVIFQAFRQPSHACAKEKKRKKKEEKLFWNKLQCTGGNKHICLSSLGPKIKS